MPLTHHRLVSACRHAAWKAQLSVLISTSWVSCRVRWRSNGFFKCCPNTRPNCWANTVSFQFEIHGADFHILLKWLKGSSETRTGHVLTVVWFMIYSILFYSEENHLTEKCDTYLYSCFFLPLFLSMQEMKMTLSEIALLLCLVALLGPVTDCTLAKRFDCELFCRTTGFHGNVGGCRCSFTLFTSKRRDNTLNR